MRWQVEATWLYAEAVDELSKLSTTPTVAGKLGVLAAVVEALVRATRGRCEELSADDLVPLMVLAFVGARVGEGVLAFEAFVLDECVTGVVSFGKESYCACTAAVALGFLRQLRLDDDLP